MVQFPRGVPPGTVGLLIAPGIAAAGTGIVMIYVFFLDYYVSGLTAGAVKG